MNYKKETQFFCENIKYLRKKHSLSLTSMAKKMGVSKKTLESIEQGVIPERMTCRVLFNISKNFGIEPPEMLSEFLE
ncbi:MAG: helix-turn-helix transcriptional regulator [Ruminococcaceae bacterium]|nr:helix-turn-helix transcriptional regulator [Oscillospiraceae bacterium]